MSAAALIHWGLTTLFGHVLADLFVLETFQVDADLFARWVVIGPSLRRSSPSPDIANTSLLICRGETELVRTP